LSSMDWKTGRLAEDMEMVIGRTPG
jgi:hypothetical protein